MKPLHLLAAAGLLLVLAIGLFVMPTPGKPDFECVPDGRPSSGFVDGDCNVSIESYEDYREWSTGPRWDNVAGLALLVGSLGAAAAALVVSRRGKRADRHTTTSPGGGAPPA